ncbi:EsaB/YukD family protein [Anaerosacchariphilus polymeriproducens]|uniref:YukD n=1 Tax=Anaerosacchariphilus polymeriproducens TaxID=1812858 RepID=A0A371AXC9_9FIRM|nr:EsaB/YukD family protein [Anaerosacchariphilus polymeriproducens]RDU24233.1 hypothetical protein DWV06_05920 [Anaerosacchariphilus polymeriproducens]
MKPNKAIVELNLTKYNQVVDIEVPLDISVYELVCAVNQAFQLEQDTSNINTCHLKTEHPIGFFTSTQKLEECGIVNGTIIRI